LDLKIEYQIVTCCGMKLNQIINDTQIAKMGHFKMSQQEPEISTKTLDTNFENMIFIITIYSQIVC
jgi:hypothetical protein